LPCSLDIKILSKKNKEKYFKQKCVVTHWNQISYAEGSQKNLDAVALHIPVDVGCGIVLLNYFNGESKWSVVSKIEPNDDIGPIDIPEEVEDNEEVSSRICMGCLKDKKCYPLGYRKSGEYCSENNGFVEQLKADSICDNNFECNSNLCIDGECLSSSLWRKILNFFKGLFGR